MIFTFMDYELDLRCYELRCGGTPVKLEPQVFNLLAYLIQHRERVVSKEELFAQVWPGRVVSEAALTSRLMAARRAVGDNGRLQTVIQTFHGRGYRFISAVDEHPDEVPVPSTPFLPGGAPVAVHGRRPPSADATRPSEPRAVQRSPKASVSLMQGDVSADTVRTVGPGRLVGRQGALTQLHRWLQQALRGSRQTVFVTGEAGLGKTTLIEIFLGDIGSELALWIGRGQCLEHYGAGEAYLPVLEALGRLCKEPDGQELIGVLAQRAPTWLVQMPWLVHGDEFEALQRRVLGATRERMLREMAEAIEVLTASRPLVLVLEDLHWSDYATLDLMTLLAQRREPARFLLLGTYRPEAVGASGHPLQGVLPRLQLHQHCQELALRGLSQAEVETYLVECYRNDALATALGPMLYRRTEGNPLFMVNLLEHWIAHDWLSQEHGRWMLRSGWEVIAREIPPTLRELVMQRQSRLSPMEQRLVEVASVAGLEFSAASIAAGLAAEVVETEGWCEELTRHGQFLQVCGVDTWPDGTVATRYRFQHALYQDAVYERLPAARQTQLHQRIGTREEAGYGARCGEIAVRLARHFERAHDLPRAVQYHQQAAQQALQRSGYQDAITHLTKGLALLQTWPDTSARTQQELDLQIRLGAALITSKGPAAPEVEQTYARARTLCLQVGDTPQLLPTLWGLYMFYQNRGGLLTARELGEQLYRLAQRQADPTFLLEAHAALGGTLLYLGHYAEARQHLEQGIALVDPAAQEAQALRRGVAPGVRCLADAALALWGLGYPAQALQRSQEAIALAQALVHPFSLATAQHRTAFLHYLDRQTSMVQVQADALLPLASGQGFPPLVGLGMCWRGWALAMQGQKEAGLTQLQEGIATVLATGETLVRPLCLVLLAEAVGHAGQVAEGLRLLAEALMAFEASGRADLLAEAYRLQGEFLLQQAVPDTAQAEAALRQALAIARHQQAKSWELRAAMSLCRLWHSQGKRTETGQLLAPILGWFTEGFDTPDLQEARVLLEELGHEGKR